MLLMLEQFLRDALEADDFRLPYWDWAGDAELADPSSSALWSGALLGRFAQPDWRVRLGPNPTGRNPAPVDRPLERDLGRDGRLSRRDELRTLVQNNTVYDQIPFDLDAGGFRNNLEGNIGVGHHNQVHNWIGGDMAVSTSPNDPAFYLVHGNVDRIWTAWQRQHPDAPYVPPQTAPAELTFHRIDDVMHTFFDEPFRLTIAQVLDASGRYTYDTLDDLVPLVA
jgi:tyrosinase